jgi:transposase
MELGGVKIMLEKSEGERNALAKIVKKLETELAIARKNSSNSSKPPSSDIVKPKKSGGNETIGADGKPLKRKIGGQPGHERHLRPEVPLAEIPLENQHVYDLTICPDCGGALLLQPGEEKVIQQLEMIPLKVEVQDHRAPRYWCAKCRAYHYAEFPMPVEIGQGAGFRLVSHIAYMKSVLHASYSSIRDYIRDAMNITISRGYINKLIYKVSAALKGPFDDLVALLKSEEFLNIDETGHPLNKERYWTWCFCALDYVVYKVEPSRRTQVLIDVLTETFNGVIGCDYFTVYRKFMKESDVKVQFCLAHYIRDILFLTTLPGADVKAYGERLIDGMRKLFHIIHRRDEMPPEDFTAALESTRDQILRDALTDVPDTRETRNVAKRLREYGDSYFTFITTPEMEPTNNVAERAMRFVAIDRRMTHGTRSKNGNEWCERIWTMIGTCKKRGVSVYHYIVDTVARHFNGEEVRIPVLNTS